MLFKKVPSLTQKEEIKLNIFLCGNILPLFIKLEKLIQISVLISVQVSSIQCWEVCDKSKILMKLRTFWTTLVLQLSRSSPHSCRLSLTNYLTIKPSNRCNIYIRGYYYYYYYYYWVFGLSWFKLVMLVLHWLRWYYVGCVGITLVELVFSW